MILFDMKCLRLHRHDLSDLIDIIKKAYLITIGMEPYFLFKTRERNSFRTFRSLEELDPSDFPNAIHFIEIVFSDKIIDPGDETFASRVGRIEISRHHVNIYANLGIEILNAGLEKTIADYLEKRVTRFRRFTKDSNNKFLLPGLVILFQSAILYFIEKWHGLMYSDQSQFVSFGIIFVVIYLTSRTIEFIYGNRIYIHKNPKSFKHIVIQWIFLLSAILTIVTLVWTMLEKIK